MGHILNSIKFDYFNDQWNFKIFAVKTRQWPYYTNVYYKYTHGSFNINNENYYFKIIILYIINFVKLLIIRPQTKFDIKN
jgi:hypothetical protein